MRLRKLAGKEKELIDAINKDIPMKELELMFGVSRQAIWKFMKHYGLKVRRNPQLISYICLNPNCKKQFYNQELKHSKYCSMKCYIDDRTNNKILHNTSGISERACRQKARKLLGITDKVIHHIDGNVANNDPSNLMVFENNSEHIKYHHSLRMNKNG